MAIQEHKDILFTELIVNKKNPRHPEFESESAAINYFCISKSAKTKKLCQSILDNDFFGDSTLLITDAGNGKFIVLDGNRRLTALKILNNPNLVPDAPECSSLKRLAQRNHIDDRTVHCYYYEDPAEAKERIRSLHTNSETREEWDQIGQIRFDFENDIVPPLWFQLIEANDPTLFENINNTSTIGRLLSRAVIDHYLPIDENLKFRTPASLAKFQEIIADISAGSTTSRHLNRADARSQYLESIFNSRSHSSPLLQSEVSVPSNEETIIPTPGLTSPSTSAINPDTQTPSPMVQRTSQPTITEHDGRSRSSNIFSDLRITIGAHDSCDERLIDGITKVLLELNSLNSLRPNQFYLSKFILIRSILEQSLKLWFYKFHRPKYDTLSANGGKDIRFEDLIKNSLTIINAGKPCFMDSNIDSMFNVFFSNSANKDLLDHMVHHPAILNQTRDILIFFSEGSIFHILNHILNYQEVVHSDLS